MKYVIIGGAGAMGRITARDLMEFAGPSDEIIIADYNLAKAQEISSLYHDPRVKAVRIDVKNTAESARALEGAFVIINCVQYQLNLEVMELALAAEAHYIDLGGLFHMTRKQLVMNERFRSAELTAIIGMGAAPGITNLLSRVGADQLDEVREIHTRVAGVDQTKYKDVPALPVSYSLQTILEEFSFEPAVFTKGEFTFVKPMSGATPQKFPAPVGVRKPMYTIHSEVATLPLSFRDKGVREVSFKIAFDSEFLQKVRFLRDLGMASHEVIDLAGIKVKPIEVVNRVAMSQHSAKQVGALKQTEYVRAVVKGLKRGKKQTIVLDCLTRGMPAWGMGTDVNTGCPPAVAALMLASGEITERGALPPETCVPAAAFFKHLKRRKMTVVQTKKSGWGFGV